MNQGLRTLVFGGSGTLGRVVCQELIAAGSRVAFTYHTQLQARDELSQAFALQADLNSVEAVERTVDDAAAALGGIDAFVQCAGLARSPDDPVNEEGYQQIQNVREAGWDRLMGVNVKSTFFACQRLIPHLRSAGGGNIVLLGSVDGIKPMPTPVHYATSKAALVGMTQSLAKELGKDQIRVNLIAPGLLEAGVSQTLPPQLHKEYLKHCGMKRFGRVSEIAAVVVWLALKNTYVTGKSIVIDGAL